MQDTPCANNRNNSINTNCNIGVSNQNKPKSKIFFSKKICKQKNEKENETPILFLSKKILHFKVEKGEEYNKKKLPDNVDVNEGRWTKEEHDKFLDGIVQYGINWKKVKILISSRTSIQVRSHAQKFFRKLKMCKDENLGIDFTKESVSSIRDMIFQIKSINKNYNIKNIFKYLSDKFDNSKRIKKIDVQKYNNLINNQNNEQNSINYFPNLLYMNQMNNAVPLNQKILFNNNTNSNSNNFYDYQNIINNNLLMNELKNFLLMNNLTFKNNDIILNNTVFNLQNPHIISILDKLVTLIRLNNNNFNNNNISFNSINAYLNCLCLNNNELLTNNLNVLNFNNNNLLNTNLNTINLNNNNNLLNTNLNTMNLNGSFLNTNLNNINIDLNNQSFYNPNLNNTMNLFNNLLNPNTITNNNINDLNNITHIERTNNKKPKI